MRTLIIALLAFATGTALTATVLRTPAAPITAQTLASAPSTPPPAAADTDPATGTGLLPADGWPGNAPSPEQVMYAQSRLMQHALDALSPRVPGVPNLYLVSFAGDGGEDVFRNEAEYAATLFRHRYGARAHTLVLENNPATLDSRPLASWSNLETALTGVARVMDPQQDILMLYLTSHGDPEHTLLVDMDPLPLDQIGAPDLAGILAEHPFKWKVVVVNACYSGGFVPPLQGEGTLVITAARSDRSSFGCGNDSAATYFGRAWLVDALNRTADPIAAFRQAHSEVARWERQDRLTPSEPQISIGKGISDQLARWRHGDPIGPPVPFRPDAAGNTPATR